MSNDFVEFRNSVVNRRVDFWNGITKGRNFVFFFNFLCCKDNHIHEFTKKCVCFVFSGKDMVKSKTAIRKYDPHKQAKSRNW